VALILPAISTLPAVTFRVEVKPLEVIAPLTLSAPATSILTTPEYVSVAPAATSRVLDAKMEDWPLRENMQEPVKKKVDPCH
jgi:hypothetical protein